MKKKRGRGGTPGKAPGGGPVKAPDCLKCRHFYVTWDKRFPRGCSAFGVKTQGMPSAAVFRSTGRHCPAFSPSPKIKD